MFIRSKKAWILSIFSAAAIVGAGAIYYFQSATIWISPDELGVVIAHFGSELPPGQVLAGPGQKGVREQVLGPGTHTISPFLESVERFPQVHIYAGRDAYDEGDKKIPASAPEVGIVTSLVGKPLREGEFLANPGEKGVQKRVLVPGRYALNPYAFRVEKAPATIIDAGYVGVVTHLAGAPSANDLVKSGERGVLEDAIPPGLYWLNPYEFKVTQVKVGYQEIAFEGGDSITFPSADGDTIKIDATVVWGIMPGDAPHIVKQFGSEKAVVDNAIRPQAESKARVAGSNYRSREFVEGDSRERFQDEFFRKLREELETKHVRVLLALVRNIEVPHTVRKPIQASKIAVEEELTNRVRTETAKTQTELNTIRGNIQIEATRVRAETEKLAEEEVGRAEAEASRLQADTRVKVSEIQFEAAQLRSESKILLGKASNGVMQKLNQYYTDGLRMRAGSFGDPTIYSLWRFAESLNNDLKIEIRETAAGGGGGGGNAAADSLLKALQSLSQKPPEK